MTNPIYKLIGYIVGIFVANGIIMWVYNSILPEMYGFKPIGYWQLFGMVKYFQLMGPEGIRLATYQLTANSKSASIYTFGCRAWGDW